MKATLPDPIYSVADAVAQIYRGEDPWYALGCFLHDWWSDAVDYRHELIAEPIPIPGMLEEKHWAAFCAAMVEELCFRTGFPCPGWTSRHDYTLKQPWFYYPQTSQRDWLLTTTPESFKRHNVFVGGNVLDNKYELKKTFDAKPAWKSWLDEELQHLLTSS